MTSETVEIKVQNATTVLEQGKEWDQAIKAVDYPVYLKPLHFHHAASDDLDSEEIEAIGETNTGRMSKFFGVVVDRFNNGELSTIACVTDSYGTIPPREVYESFRDELKEAGIENTPRMVYVSGNGGKQILSVRIDGQLAPNCQDEIGMMVHMITSLDGTKKHSMRLTAFDIESETEIVGVCNETFDVSARHTRTIRDRHFAFESTMTEMIKQWNETIIPAMTIMNDAKFDRSMALDMLESILEDSKIPERHIEKAKAHYADTAGSGSDSIYTVMRGMSGYFKAELSDKPERAEQFKVAINKRARGLINSTLKKLGKDTI